MAVPAEPVIFFKATTRDRRTRTTTSIIPKGSTKTDWEVELAVVIGKRASYVAEADALAARRGLRAAQRLLGARLPARARRAVGQGEELRHLRAARSLPRDTRRNRRRARSLELWLTVNGERKQNGTTRDLVFGVPMLVSYISQFMTLLPGDVISTGTPAGVAMGHTPPRFLQPGDVVELGIDRTRLVAPAAARAYA